MTDLLELISDKLTEAEIPYEYGEWTSQLQYPYFVGSYDQTDYRYEDGCTEGTFTIDGWTRGPRLQLVQAADAIRKAFEDLQITKDGQCFFIRYGGSTSVPTSDAGLYRITITLYTYQWKGD